MDNRLYGDNAVGYGWTTDILCALATLALFWLLAELWTSPVLAFAGAGLFALWTTDRGGAFTTPLTWAAGLIVVAGFARHGLTIARYVPASLVLLFLASEVAAPEVSSSDSLSFRMTGWLPGRTASVMTLFALVAMAAYVRYERSRGIRLLPPTPSANDTPGKTRGRSSAPRCPAIWLSLSVLGLAAALASYEQAVMLPGALFGLAVYLRLRGGRPDWRAQIAFLGLLVGYLALRHAVLPTGVSRYQAQQFRHGSGVWIDLGSYLLPGAATLFFYGLPSIEGIWSLFSGSLAGMGLSLATTVTTLFQARRNWETILAGWALSGLAFLPMAWLKQFGHYHYWPLALRTIFILGVSKLTWNLVSTAVCPPALQAPRRPSPAPGSLPRL